MNSHERFSTIADKVAQGQRLDAQDGLALLEHPDLLAVGQLANQVRERRHRSIT